jgi:ADP-L-glycero-D-manno-heptose 6-epimerase
MVRAFSVVVDLHISACMILVTGGAGFIGSNLHAALAAEGQEVMLCDWLGHEGAKWRNLRHHPPTEIIRPDELFAYLEHDMRITTVVHLGAVSETTATDADFVWHNNVTFSQKLWTWCAQRHVRIIYASSAATYGSGAEGFEDDISLPALKKLKPLNLYGWSKHAFDMWVAQQNAEHAHMPRYWAGVKFFNVYGPNEYHKGKMISVVKVKHDELMAGGPVKLFKSDRPDIANGAQMRDFIHVDDVVAALKFMTTAQDLSGLYNLGTGQARSYMDLAKAVCVANGKPGHVEFVDMPAALHGQYQSFTQAKIDRLRQAGFNHEFRSLEDGIADYIQNYLLKADPYR